MARRDRRREAKLSRQQQVDETLVDITEVRDQGRRYFDDHRNLIIAAAAGLVLLVGAYLLYQELIKKPAEASAMEQMSQAIVQFEQDSFALALTNPGGGYDGFEAIIDNYGSTKAGNLAKYYAGISHLNMGAYDQAIDYLKSFSPAGSVTPIMKAGALGDAYSEQGDFDQALSQYKKASSTSDNEFLNSYYLKKYGLLQMHQGNMEEAQSTFKELVRRYPGTIDATEVTRYITSG